MFNPEKQNQKSEEVRQVAPKARVFERFKKLRETFGTKEANKFFLQATTGLLTPVALMTGTLEAAKASPNLKNFSPEAKQLVEEIQTERVAGGHGFKLPGVEGMISAQHVTQGEAEFTKVPGTRDISVSQGFDLNQIKNWRMPKGEVRDAILTTTGNSKTGFNEKQFQVECKMLGISFAEMWGEEEAKAAQLVVCLQNGEGYDIVKGNSGSGLILQNGAVAVTSMHNYPLWGGEKNQESFNAAIALVQEEFGVDEAQATELVDGGGFFEVFGVPENLSPVTPVLPTTPEPKKDLFDTLDEEGVRTQEEIIENKKQTLLF